MIFGFLRREKIAPTIKTPQEVTDSKEQLQAASNAASANTQKVKRILTADHVTLRIHVAAHGGKHV